LAQFRPARLLNMRNIIRRRVITGGRRAKR
jgi:hypothetical protein